MNETVKRIVDLLFDPLEETAEVRELREEVLSDSLEQFNDLRARGLTEDEAVAAVAESLSGMEEALSVYSRKGSAEPERVAEKAPDQPKKPAQPDGVYFADALEVSLKSADIRVVRGEAPGLRVKVENDEAGVIGVEESGGALRITQHSTLGGRGVSFSYSSEKSDSFSGLILGVMKKALSAITTLEIQITVEVGAPLRQAVIGTASGEVEWKDGPVRRVEVSTASGDVTLRLADPAEAVQARTMSGDVRFYGETGEMSLTTMSGDVYAEGAASRLTLRSTSGDVDFTGLLAEADLRTTSGDVTLKLQGGENPRIRIRGTSTSGDVSLHLPAASREIDLSLRTVSGDKTLGDVQIVPGAPIRAELTTVSGDVEVW